MPENHDIAGILESISRLEKSIARVDRQVGEITNAYGRFVEDLLIPSLKARLAERGFVFERSRERMREVGEKDGRVLTENDLVVEATWEGGRRVVVLASLKAHLREKRINEHLAEMAVAHELYPRFRDREFLGVVGGVTIPWQVRRMAEKRGLFVVHVSEDVAQIVNGENFQPRVWRAPTE